MFAAFQVDSLKEDLGAIVLLLVINANHNFDEFLVFCSEKTFNRS